MLQAFKLVPTSWLSLAPAISFLAKLC